MRSFGRQLRAEARKATNLLILALFIVWAVFLWQDATRTGQLASVQPQAAVMSQMAAKQQLKQLCVAGESAQCVNARHDIAVNQYLVENSIEQGRIAASLITFPGLLTFVSHQFAAGMGWLFVALVAALHLTGEESRGTVGASVLAAGRMRYLLAKIVSIWSVSVVAVIAAAVVLYELASTFAVSPSVPTGFHVTGEHLSFDGSRTLTPDPTWASWSHAFGEFWHAAAVLAVIAVVFCALATRFRRVTRAAAAGALVVGAFYAIAAWLHGRAWGPMGGVARLLSLDHVPYGVIDVRLFDITGRPSDMLMRPYGAPVLGPNLSSQPAPVPYLGLVIWLVVAVVGVGFAVRAYARRGFPG